MNLIDSHAHLTDPKYLDDMNAVLQRAKEAGMDYLLTVGTTVEDSRAAVALAEAHDFMYAAVGVHPHDAKGLTDDGWNELATLARHDKVIGIGETGLDYHYMHSPRETQMEVFRGHIALAKKTGLPLIVHSREAKEDLLQILEKENGFDVPGILHSFTGDLETAQKAIARGWFISFSGMLTFKSAQELRDVASKLPYENLLIETDCPYLAPVPHRGKRNEPAWVMEVANQLSELLPLTPSDVGRIARANFERLFGLGETKEADRYTYEIRDNLYLNITSRCTNECTFCVRDYVDGVSGYNLWLQKEPSAQEVIAALPDDLSKYEEVVFCGYGEPTLRNDVIVEVAKVLKKKGAKKIRVTTDGHANLIHSNNVVPEWKGLIDIASVSLNAHDEDSYNTVCKPKFKNVNVFEEVLAFIKECSQTLPEVECTVVRVPEIDVEKCRALAEGMGCTLRVREYNIVG